MIKKLCVEGQRNEEFSLALAVDDMPAVDFPAVTHKHPEQHARRQTCRHRRSPMIVPQHSADSHPPTAFNCLPCSCFFCALSCTVPSITPASLCTLEYAIQNLQTLTYFCHRSIQLQPAQSNAVCITSSHPVALPNAPSDTFLHITCCLLSSIHSYVIHT
jgi:hypothetical protein